METRLDKTVMRKTKLGDKSSETEYWLSQPPIKHLEMIEELRRQYNEWKYGPRQGFQRVYRIVKRK